MSATSDISILVLWDLQWNAQYRHVCVMDCCAFFSAVCWGVRTAAGPRPTRSLLMLRRRWKRQQHARPRGARRPARVSAPGTEIDTHCENRETPCFVYVWHVGNSIENAMGNVICKQLGVEWRRWSHGHFPTSVAVCCRLQIVLDSRGLSDLGKSRDRARACSLDSKTRLCVFNTFTEQT